MITQLRSQALLDGRFTDVSCSNVENSDICLIRISNKAATNCMKGVCNTSNPVTVIKRKVEYITDNMEANIFEARHRMVNMDMNDK